MIKQFISQNITGGGKKINKSYFYFYGPNYTVPKITDSNIEPLRTANYLFGVSFDYPLDYDDGNDISRNLIDPEDLFIRYIYLDSLKIIFSTLTPDFRDTIIFHYFYGFKYSEIACMFHISERAVKKRIAVAKKRVRTMFQKEDFL